MVLLGLVLTVAILYYLRHREDFHLITAISIWAIVSLVFINCLLALCRGYELKSLMGHYHLKLRFRQWFGIPLMSTCANLLIPVVGGTSFKAVYLKKIHDLRYSSFVASVAIASLLRLLISGLLGTVLLMATDRKALVLLPISALVLLGTGLFLLFGHRLPDRLVSFWPTLVRVLQEWRKIRTDQALILRLVLFNALIFFLSSLSTLVSFQAFSLNISVAGSGVINAFATISRAPNLIPGNFGLKEALYIFIAGVEGITVNQALHAAIIHRILGMSSTLLLAPFFAHQLVSGPGQEEMVNSPSGTER